MLTSMMTGMCLDYAVHLALNKQHDEERRVLVTTNALGKLELHREIQVYCDRYELFGPSGDHLHAYMLIWHNLIGVSPVTRDGSVWQASLSHAKVIPVGMTQVGGYAAMQGKTPTEAGLRTFVRMHLGSTVKLPEELTCPT